MVLDLFPGFVGRANFPDRNLRIYVHKAGFGDIFGGEHRVAFDRWVDYLDKTTSGGDNHSRLTDFDYVLAAAWGDVKEGVPAIDFFCFSDLDVNSWPANPDVQIWNISGERMLMESTTCGDSLIMLGREEQHRRMCRNLEHYVQNPPNSELTYLHPFESSE